MRQYEQRRQIANLPAAQRKNLGIAGVPFHAAVPTEVVVATVAIGLPVRFVVLLVVRNQIGQRKAVMTSNEVNAVERLSSAALIQIGASGQTRRQHRNHARISLHEAAQIVPKPAIPLGPSAPGWKRAYLVKPGRVPSLRNHFGAGQYRIG